MWLRNNIIAEVDRVATVHYVGMTETATWNQHRRDNELRLFTGWCWTARNGSAFRQGLKTMSCCYRDAYYTLVAKDEAPPIARPRLRVVAKRAA